MLLTTLMKEGNYYNLHDVNRNITIINTEKDNITDAIEVVNNTLDNDLQTNKITDSLYEIATIYGRVRKGIISI